MFGVINRQINLYIQFLKTALNVLTPAATNISLAVISVMHTPVSFLIKNDNIEI